MLPIQNKSKAQNNQYPMFSPDPKSSTVKQASNDKEFSSMTKYNTMSTIQFNMNFNIPTQRKHYPLSKGNLFNSKSAKITKNYSDILTNDENNNINTSSWTNIGYNKVLSTNFKSNFNTTNMKFKKMNEKKIKAKMQKTKVAVKFESLPQTDRNIVSLKIETNWGDTSNIVMNFIALLDKNDRQIDPFYHPKNIISNLEGEGKSIVYIASIPELSSLKKLEYLLDTSYIKDDETIFNEKFDDQKFTIFISIDQSIEIGSIRIFNLPDKNISSVKDVSISMNEGPSIQGQIPQDFGIDLKLNNLSSSIHKAKENSSHVIPRRLAYQDQYGNLPIKLYSEIRIEIIETYNTVSSVQKNSKNCIGVNGFDFYDMLNNQISAQKINENSNFIQKAIIRGISEFIHCGMLLRINKITYNEDEMLLGIMDHKQNPTFIFVFNKPTYLSRVVIWNYNGHGDNLNCGIKKLKLFADNDLIWIGKINRGNGKLRKMMDNTYTIYLFDQIQDVSKI